MGGLLMTSWLLSAGCIFPNRWAFGKGGVLMVIAVVAAVGQH